MQHTPSELCIALHSILQVTPYVFSPAGLYAIVFSQPLLLKAYIRDSCSDVTFTMGQERATCVLLMLTIARWSMSQHYCA